MGSQCWGPRLRAETRIVSWGVPLSGTMPKALSHRRRGEGEASMPWRPSMQRMDLGPRERTWDTLCHP